MGILDRFSLAGKKSLVTGGGTGIGRAIATGLAEAGADVALVGRRPEPLEETAALVRASGRRTLVLPADVRDKEEVDRFIDAIVAAWGRLDVAVNNSGIGAHMDTLDASERAWDEMIDTNHKGPFLCMQA
ncbi:MAG: SDR family NAD(P)-dependent oxidoreductase, partial [Chloroflexota bacterium]|nr:SDR family NAD(P)-dependent oxidoreductase [Chloroflexota bacterium]